MASNPEHTNSGQPVKPYPYQLPIDNLLNPLWALQEIKTATVNIPPKTDKTRTPEKIFNYPSSVQDMNKDTILPLPRGWLYLDMNIALENVTEPSIHAAFTDTNDPYPMLTASYKAPEILLRIFETPTDPEYNKFTQQVFPKAEMRDLQQFAALHEIKKSYGLFVIMEDKQSTRAKVHLNNIREQYRLLDVHAQQNILQILAPPPHDKIVTHFSAVAKYPGEDEGTDWTFIQSSQGRSYIGDMVDFWEKAAPAYYKTMKFRSNEQMNNDTSMEDEASSAGTDGEDTPIINMMQQGGAALQNNNNLADTMTTESQGGETGDATNVNKNKSKQKEKEKIVYVPKTPSQLAPSHLIRSQNEQYEQQRRRQLEIEKVVDRLYDANQFDETKYTAVCTHWHQEKQYTIQQVEEDLKKAQFKTRNINQQQQQEQKGQEQDKRNKNVRFGGSRFGAPRNVQYNIAPPNPSYIPNRHNYTDYSNGNAPGPQPPPNANPSGTSPNGNANNINANTGHGGGNAQYNNSNTNNGYNGGCGTYYDPNTNKGYGPPYGGGYYDNNKYNANGNNANGGANINNNYNSNTNTGNYSLNGNNNNNNEEKTTQQLLKEIKEKQQQLDQYLKEKKKNLDKAYHWHTAREATRKNAQQQLNQQFENIARRHLPKDKQHTFNNPSNEKDLAGSITAMLNGNQLPARQHTNTLPKDPVAALPTPIPPATPMEHRYATMMENNNDIFNFSMDNINQIDHYVRDFDYQLNATVTQNAVPTAQSIAINTSLVNPLLLYDVSILL